MVKEVLSEFNQLSDRSSSSLIPDIITEAFFREMLQKGIVVQISSLTDPDMSHTIDDCTDAHKLHGRLTECHISKCEKRAIMDCVALKVDTFPEPGPA